MKKGSKRWLSLLLAALISASFASTASAAWSKDNEGWRWTESGQPVSGWKQIDNNWYYFSDSGLMQTGWLQDGGKWYYLTGSGSMATDWIKDSGKWYYLNSSGSMATGWLKNSGKWYYLNSSGSMATGWLKNGGKWYYLTNSGSMATGCLQDGGKWYYLNAGGDMATGWVDVNNRRYFIDSDGVMQTGVIQIDGNTYYFNEDGVMQTGVIQIDKLTYRFDVDGKAIGRAPTPDRVIGKPSSTGGSSGAGGSGSFGGGTGGSGGGTGGSGGSGGGTGGSGGSGGNTGSSNSSDSVTVEGDSPLKGVLTTTRSEDSAAEITFTATEPGYFYCYPVRQTLRSGAPSSAEIVENGEQFGIREGKNVISLTGLDAGARYTLYTAAENLYQEVTALPPVNIRNEVDESVLDQKDRDLSIESVAASAGQVTVRLNKPLDKALTKESFSIYCPAGSQMAITGVSTSDKRVYTLTTSYYRENTYFMEITLPGGRKLEKSFTGRFDCPEITDPEIDRTSASTASLTFASDREGTFYYLTREKTAARTSVPTESEILKSGKNVPLSSQLNQVSLDGLAEGKAYELYYLAQDGDHKKTPVLGPLEIPAKASETPTLAVKECAAISDSQFRVVLDQPVSGLKLSDFSLSCPRGFLKLGNLSSSDGQNYIVSLRTGSMFKEKVNYTVHISLPGGKTAKGIFYTDLYGPDLTGISVSRYADETAGVVCTADRAGYVYCMPSEIAYSPNGSRPTVAEVIANGQKLSLRNGGNQLAIENISPTDKTIWYVTENAFGFRREFVDHFDIPDTISTPPSEGDTDDAPYTILDISGSNKELRVTVGARDDDGFLQISKDEVSISGSGIYLTGRSLSTTYYSDNPDICYIRVLEPLEPGEYQFEWKYGEFWLDYETYIPLTTVTKTFVVQNDLKVVSK